MKRWVIGLVLVLLLLLLAFTKSLYVEWGEIYFITGTLSLVSVVYLIKLHSTIKLLIKSALIGFVFCWVFGVFDLMIDHYLYFLPNPAEDGAPMSIGFKLEEYSDDLFVGCIRCMIVVLAVTFIANKMNQFFTAKNIKF